MTRHRSSTPGLSAPATVALIGVLLLAIAAAAVGLWFTFNPVGVSPSFWDGATDVMRAVRLLGSCQ